MRDVIGRFAGAYSPEVLDAKDIVVASAREFQKHALTVRMLRQQQAETTEPMRALHEAREATRTAAATLAAMMRSELTELPRQDMVPHGYRFAPIIPSRTIGHKRVSCAQILGDHRRSAAIARTPR